MIRLIQNELYKIFHRKTIYVMGIIIFGFVLINNILYKKFYNADGVYNGGIDTIKYQLEFAKSELETLDPSKDTDKGLYAEYKTSYEILELSSKYDINSWQYSIINNKMYDVIYNRNYCKYVDDYNSRLKEYEEIYDRYLSYLEKDDFKEFAYLELEDTENSINLLSKEKETTTDKQRLNEIENTLKNLEFEREIINLRINNDISYANNYLNTALEEYKNSYTYLENTYNNRELSYEEKLTYNENKKNLNVSKYIIDNNVDLNRKNTLRSNLINSIDNYMILIIILIIIISGTTISSEFNKGTIKQLLVRPYTRTNILLAKFISAIIILMISIFYLFMCELLIGGMFLSFDSLSTPVIVYNLNTNSLVSYNVFTYTLITVLAKLPMLLLLLTLAFTLSTISANSQISISIPIIGYMFSEVINALAISFDLKWMKYFPTLNWNLNEYLFGNLGAFKYTNMTFSIIITVIYFIIMLMISVIVFKKKNIKNV